MSGASGRRHGGSKAVAGDRRCRSRMAKRRWYAKPSVVSCGRWELMDVKHDFQNQWSHMTNNVANMPDDELRTLLQQWACQHFCVMQEMQKFESVSQLFLGIRSSKRIAKWLSATFHFGIGIVHFFDAS